jgi:hypothetical protein
MSQVRRESYLENKTVYLARPMSQVRRGKDPTTLSLAKHRLKAPLREVAMRIAQDIFVMSSNARAIA